MILVRDTLKPAEAIASNLVEASTVLTSFFDLPEGICNSSIPTTLTFTLRLLNKKSFHLDA